MLTKSFHIIFIFFAILIVMAASQLITGCNSKSEKNSVNNHGYVNYESLPDQTGMDVTVQFIDSNFTKAILRAKRARVFTKRLETIMDGGLEVDFMSAIPGKRASHLTSDSAKVDDKTKDMLASGHVVVIGDSSHAKLETSVLFWNNSTQKLYTNEFVKITSPKETIQGYGMESDQNLINYKIFKVSGVQR